MKNCERCIWRRYDQNLEKVFKCKLKDKHFDYPRLHGWLCKKYANRLINNEPGSRP